MSTEGTVPTVVPIALPPANDNAQSNGEDAQLKEETTRDGVEDLTLDEEAEDSPAVTHNDVVRSELHLFVLSVVFFLRIARD